MYKYICHCLSIEMFCPLVEQSDESDFFSSVDMGGGCAYYVHVPICIIIYICTHVICNRTLNYTVPAH